MALSADDKKRIMELAAKGKVRKKEEDPGLNLAGSAATPLMAGGVRPAARGVDFGWLLSHAPRLALFILLPAVLLTAGSLYAMRYDLQQMEFGAVFDSSRGTTLRGRFMEQVRLQKQKRALLDEGRAFSFANDHIASARNADQVLTLDPTNVEATALRATALDRQVVYAQGALQEGDVDEAVVRVQRSLSMDPGHEAGRAFLRTCAETLLRRARKALDTLDYPAAGGFVRRAEAIWPGFPDALSLHRKLVGYHVTRADTFYLEGDYVQALEEIELVRGLEDDNPRTAGLFEKIDEKIGMPSVTINSVLKLGGTPRIMATIKGRTVQLTEGQTYRNLRVVSITHRTGVVVFEQIYTGEQLRIVKVPGSRGAWISAPR